MKRKLLNLLKDTITIEEWEANKYNIRAMFTTLYYIDAINTNAELLKGLYNCGCIAELNVSFEEFEYFMLHDINKQF